MPTRFLVLTALLCAMPAATAVDGAPPPEAVAAAPPAAPVPSDWSVTVGGGALALPSYPGAASSRLMPLPFVDVRYRQLFFLSPFAGFGVNAIATGPLQVGVAVLPDFGRSASSADRLRGWGDVSAGANMKVFGKYSLGRIALLADVRRQLGAGNGTLIDAGITSMFPLARHLLLFSTATLTWADAQYSRTYFGIDANQSAVAVAQGRALPLYSAAAGLRDATLTLPAVAPLDERWSVQSLLRAELLLGDAAASPLTERRIQPTVGAFLAYRL
jgi:MipA family protein